MRIGMYGIAFDPNRTPHERLAMAIICRAALDARKGSPQAKLWLRSPSCELLCDELDIGEKFKKRLAGITGAIKE